MDVIDQQTMERVFQVTDEIPLDREALVVPLEMMGEGSVDRRPDGKVQITLPAREHLDGFLGELAVRVRAVCGEGA